MIFGTVFRLVSILVLTVIGSAVSTCLKCPSQHAKAISVVPGKCDECFTWACVSGHIRHSKVPDVSATVNSDLLDVKKTKRDVIIIIKVENLFETLIILISALFVIVFLLVLLVVGCAVYCIREYRLWKSVNSCKQRHVEMPLGFSEEARENEERKSSECSGVSEPLLKTHEDPPGKMCGTADSSKGLFINLTERKRHNVQLEKGIPTSFDSGPTARRRAAQRPRKRRPPSEGDDETKPCLEGHQHNTEDYQDELATVVVDKMLVTGTYHPAEPHQGAVCIPSSEPPIQSTEDNRSYFTHMNDAPVSLIRDICMLLDEEREIDGKDYRMLAGMLEQTPAKIRHLTQLQKQNGKSPSNILLMQVFSSMENSGTLKHLRSTLVGMKRYDVIKVIDDWVSNNS